jgi:hypothetical protein
MYYCPQCFRAYSRDLSYSCVKRLYDFRADYLGGHSMYASKQSITLSLFADEICITNLNLKIPYSAIKEVKNINEKNVKALRVVALGVAGALWKKKETYLCIVYDDEIQEQNPVFKVHDIDGVQKAIYQRVAQAKKASLLPPPPPPPP